MLVVLNYAEISININIVYVIFLSLCGEEKNMKVSFL